MHQQPPPATPSFPSQSLQFLQDGFVNGAPGLRDAKAPLKIIVVGAGLGGLSTAIALARRGHKVIVLEQASRLGEVRYELLLRVAFPS
jgi:salicylate hydroxylase